MSTRKPLPLKVNVLGHLGDGITLSPEEAIARTQRLVEMANEAARQHMSGTGTGGEGIRLAGFGTAGNHEGETIVFRSAPKRPMQDYEKIKFMFEHGRWPTPHEQEGWY